MAFKPVADEQVTVEMLVCVTAYGKPDRVRADVEAASRQALQRSFGDRFTILTAPFGSHYAAPLLNGADDRNP